MWVIKKEYVYGSMYETKSNQNCWLILCKWLTHWVLWSQTLGQWILHGFLQFMWRLVFFGVAAIQVKCLNLMHDISCYLLLFLSSGTVGLKHPSTATACTLGIMCIIYRTWAHFPMFLWRKELVSSTSCIDVWLMHVTSIFLINLPMNIIWARIPL